ncbi:hypothetical protein LINGRAHAP2_LOCUS20845 [Linum grandiflorum]
MVMMRGRKEGLLSYNRLPLLEGKEVELLQWEGDAQKLLKDVRDNLKTLGRILFSLVDRPCLLCIFYSSGVVIC